MLQQRGDGMKLRMLEIFRKMFNQVLVHLHDQVFHRFLWRKNQHDLPTMYQCLKLNFGDKPAPDIASNAINILAKASQDR